MIFCSRVSRLLAAFPVLAAPFGLVSCATDPEKIGPAEYVQENSRVLSQLASYERKERYEGIATFKGLGKERGSEVIRYLLYDPDYNDYRAEVVLARLLAEWDDARAIPFLLDFVKHPDQGVVDIASEGLLVFGDNPRVRTALEEMLRSEVRRERYTAVKVLSRIKSSEILTLFAGRYKLESDAEIRGLFLSAALESRNTRRRDLLIDALTDQEPDLRSLAWENLKRRYPGIPDEVDFDAYGEIGERAQAIALLKMWAKGGRRR